MITLKDILCPEVVLRLVDFRLGRIMSFMPLEIDAGVYKLQTPVLCSKCNGKKEIFSDFQAKLIPCNQCRGTGVHS